ncbi:hypothetical protein C1645_817876 [Glomus cerebriforme]|uniref:Protein kinase domain-containing protein n=1 Tax=Glomus cerebriforme TaxID=658196 RepID=A0A397T8E9_9GLOM|nr:hypothetical protein C1645_817876 [Glomus cerebriforme]
MAHQLVCAVTYLHDEGIVHHDFAGRFKRIDISSASINQSKLFGVVPYTNPIRFDIQKRNKSNEKGNIYSIECDVSLVVNILRGCRAKSHEEKCLSEEYINKCWDEVPGNRPNINQVVNKS